MGLTFGRKVPGLQVLRGVAAMMVAYSHLMSRVVLRGLVDPGAWWLNTDLGAFGVSVFFAISGFVMIHANRAHFGRAGYRDNMAVFFKRRLARIYPLYALATLAYLVFAWTTKGEFFTATELTKSLLFIPYLNRSGLYQPVYTLGWSLNYEVFFYLVVGLLLFLPPRRAVWTICGVLCALIAFGLTLGSDPVRHHGADMVWYLTRPVMLYFVAGVLARAIPFLAAERWAARHNPVAIGVALMAVALAYHTVATQAVSAVFMFVFIRAASAWVSYAGRWMWVAEFLGDASYSLYLTHSFVLGAVTIGVSRVVHAPILATLACLVLGMAAALVLATLTYVYVERPLVRRVTGWLLR